MTEQVNSTTHITLPGKYIQNVTTTVSLSDVHRTHEQRKNPFDKAATLDHYKRLTSERHDNTFNVLLDDLSKDW
jgi:hypothetical protein